MRRSLLSLCSLLAFPAWAEVPQVVTDIPPVHSLTSLVMGDLGTPVLLLDPGADEHDFQLRPSQMQSLSQAGLIIWIGPELTPWLERATEQSTVTMLGLLDAPQTLQQPYLSEDGAAPKDENAEDEAGHEDHAEKEAGHEEHDEHAEGEAGHAEAEAGHEDHAAEEAGHDEHEGHGHTGNDPHAWLNPDNAVIWLDLIAQALSAADPDNAATYAANAAAAQAQIAALAEQIAAELAPAHETAFLTYHNAYGHFVTRFDLAFAGSIADGEAAAPGAAHLAELQDLMKTGTIACLFPEAQHDPALSAQILEGTATRLGLPLDPVGSTLQPGPQAYAELLSGLSRALADCLQG